MYKPVKVLLYPAMYRFPMVENSLCGHCCKGEFPEEVNAPVSFGPNIMAMTSYISTYQNVPFKRLTHLFETIFGLHISEGSVSNMLKAMRKFSKTPYVMIRQKAAGGKVAGAGLYPYYYGFC